MTLSMKHTEAEGTLLQGTSRGDGSAEVVKGLGALGPEPRVLLPAPRQGMCRRDDP